MEHVYGHLNLTQFSVKIWFNLGWDPTSGFVSWSVEPDQYWYCRTTGKASKRVIAVFTPKLR